MRPEGCWRPASTSATFVVTVGHHEVSDAVSPLALTYSSSSQRKRPKPSNSMFGPSEFESLHSVPSP